MEKDNIRNDQRISRKSKKIFYFVFVFIIIPNILSMIIFTKISFLAQNERELIDCIYLDEDYKLEMTLKPHENISIFFTGYYTSPTHLHLSINTSRAELDEDYVILLIRDDEEYSDEYDDSYYNESTIYFENGSPRSLVININIQISNQGGYWIVIVKNLMDNRDFYSMIGLIAWTIFIFYFIILTMLNENRDNDDFNIREFLCVNHKDKFKNITNFLPILIMLSWIVIVAIPYMDIMNFHMDPGLNYDLLIGLNFCISGFTLLMFFPLFLWVIIKHLNDKKKKKIFGIIYVITCCIVLVSFNISLITSSFNSIYSNPFNEFSLNISMIILFCFSTLIICCVWLKKQQTI